MQHMPATGVSGVDLYVKNKAGQWRFVFNGRPFAVSNTFSRPLPPGEEYLLYLPLYNGVKSVELGVPKGRTLSKPDVAAARRRKSIVWYGDSITQGGCASRPGMAHTAITGRRLDATIINLGFSGSGVMEPAMADLLAELDPSVYVLDTLGNMSVPQVSERVGPFVKKLRAARPHTPILLVEEASLKGTSPTDRGRAAQAACEELRRQGVQGLHFLANDGLLGDDEEGTVDGVHPNDLGMMQHAEVFVRALQPILQGVPAGEAKPAVAAARPNADMMKDYLRTEAKQAAQRWEAEFETRTTPEQIAAWQKQCRERLWQVLGGAPAPIPSLNARTTGTIQREGYVIEKVIFESQPGFHVTALLFLPDTGPLQAAVSRRGRARRPYRQRQGLGRLLRPMGALLALNGMAGLVYDAIDESERLQYRNERRRSPSTRCGAPDFTAPTDTRCSASAASSWAAIRRGSRFATRCGRSTTSSRGRKSIRRRSAARATAAAASSPPTCWPWTTACRRRRPPASSVACPRRSKPAAARTPSSRRGRP